QAFKQLLKMRSNTYIFGGPVPPPYLDAICAVCEILTSSEYEQIRGRLLENLRLLTAGAARLGLAVLGGQTPIISILVGDEEKPLLVVPFPVGKFRVRSAGFSPWVAETG